MGIIAESFAAYAQPLLDQTDGSERQLNTAFTMSQFCFNLARMPEDSRDRALGEMKLSLKMDDAEFDDFQRSIVIPMIRRHQEMFPRMHESRSTRFSPNGPSQGDPSQGDPSPRARPRKAAPGDAYPGTDRYAPCPCNTGRKYKSCCGKKGR
jgi:hypothetical protein